MEMAQARSNPRVQHFRVNTPLAKQYDMPMRSSALNVKGYPKSNRPKAEHQQEFVDGHTLQHSGAQSVSQRDEGTIRDVVINLQEMENNLRTGLETQYQGNVKRS